MLTLADFNGAEIDKKVATRMKEVLTLDRPFCEALRMGACGERAARVLREHQEVLQREFLHLRPGKTPWTGS